jgi:hypothetical protein
MSTAMSARLRMAGGRSRSEAVGFRIRRAPPRTIATPSIISAGMTGYGTGIPSPISSSGIAMSVAPASATTSAANLRGPLSENLIRAPTPATIIANAPSMA